jgi:hypothetical protein
MSRSPLEPKAGVISVALTHPDLARASGQAELVPAMPGRFDSAARPHIVGDVERCSARVLRTDSGNIRASRVRAMGVGLGLVLPMWERPPAGPVPS